MRLRKPSTMSLKLMAMVVMRKELKKMMMVCVGGGGYKCRRKREDKSIEIFV